MILCLDVGNTQIYGGVFHKDALKLTFRHNTYHAFSSDQLGIFLKSVLRENELDYKAIQQIAICSVVPALDYTLRSASIKYFNQEPFILQAGVKTGLKIKYRNPLEVGADRIANAIAAISLFPNKNILVVDFGTATTLCAISKDKTYLGGIIFPGMKLSMTALQERAAKLPSVEIIKPTFLIGRSTAENIQAGLFYNQLSTIQTLKQEIQTQYFPEDSLISIGTGGFSHLYQESNLFDVIAPDLVLTGLLKLVKLNCPESTS